MELTGPDGVVWSAYLEGVPAVPARRWVRQTMLPGRRLRFDSEKESRVTAMVPAGSPFLPERRLLVLLAESVSLPQDEARATGSIRVQWSRRDRLFAARRAVWASMRDAARELGDLSRAAGRVLLRLALGLRQMAVTHHR